MVWSSFEVSAATNDFGAVLLRGLASGFDGLALSLTLSLSLPLSLKYDRYTLFLSLSVHVSLFVSLNWLEQLEINRSLS